MHTQTCRWRRKGRRGSSSAQGGGSLPNPEHGIEEESQAGNPSAQLGKESEWKGKGRRNEKRPKDATKGSLFQPSRVAKTRKLTFYLVKI